ncbi:AAA family ATPase [Streptomyces sp. NBC_01221]|uniref:helix-turn-helix transcriptional regulator n=1 Tax=unclassified Streptomyces TaxID=2593676 RepID=UPI00224D2EEF|nr:MULTISPECIES: LuxR family transcriptional regulator [unclassified Streptomyces]MCX4784663.1 AAA family ATPase [Streptomyces sp. NBC_01221]MCX4799374.1 AAA family ATPase [Streptomyces sp. NBC_01242]WSJ40545.1 AAA family ATPase [Streptomyces sp. NBC_01321]WSU26018.1 AAA family ATPase [Streptomyces sp. NBC_01108]
MERLTRTVLVQREEQLAGLRGMYRACREQGRGQVALLSGPVGSGKTEVLEVFGEWAAMVGGQVLRAAGSRAERDIPLGVIWQLLHSAPLEPEALAQADELIGTAFDRLTRTAGVVEQLPPGDGLWGRALHAVFTSLTGLGDEVPVAVAVDDLHHVDAASLHCLLYVVRRFRRAPVMIVLAETTTLRPAHPLLRAELFSQPFFRRYTLPLLTADAVARLVPRDADCRGGTSARETASGLLGVTGGNPLLLRALLDENAGGTGRDSTYGPVPGDAFDQAVLRCLYRHEPVVRQVARAVALLDRRASAELIGRLLGIPPDFTAQAMRLLRGAGLTEAGRFRHPRILDLIVSDMTAEERQRLHRLAGETLDERGAAAGEVARHRRAAAWTDALWRAPTPSETADEPVSHDRSGPAPEPTRHTGRPSGDGDGDGDVLSEAERRVAELAALGHTNRQISRRLFITVSTVEQHLTRVYRKLDVKRRTDLAERLNACRSRPQEPTREHAPGPLAPPPRISGPPPGTPPSRG